MQDLFDVLGLELSEKVIRLSGYYDEQLDLLSAGMQPCEAVLDLCTGFGNIAERLVADDQRLVYGLDISPEALTYVQQKVRHARNYIPVEGDVQCLPYVSFFDGICCASTFGFDDLAPVVFGIAKALIPKGYFAVTGMESQQNTHFHELILTDAQRKVGDPAKIAAYFTPEEVECIRDFHELQQTGGIGPLHLNDSSERVMAEAAKQGLQLGSVII